MWTFSLLFTDSVPSETALLIVNALYFKAAWSYVFDEVVQQQPFTKTNGKRILIPMVKRTSRQQVATIFQSELVSRQSNFTAVAIPYEVQRNLQLISLILGYLLFVPLKWS